MYLRRVLADKSFIQRDQIFHNRAYTPLGHALSASGAYPAIYLVAGNKHGWKWGGEDGPRRDTAHFSMQKSETRGGKVATKELLLLKPRAIRRTIRRGEEIKSDEIIARPRGQREFSFGGPEQKLMNVALKT